MAKVIKRVEVIETYETELTDEQFKLYLENEDSFWKLYNDELSVNEGLMEAEEINIWKYVEEE